MSQGTSAPVPERRGAARSRAPLVVGLVVVAVALAVTGLAVATTERGGAEGPAAAVETFFEATASGSTDAVLATLPPSERQVLAEALPGLLDALDLGGGLDGTTLVLEEPVLAVELWEEEPDPGVLAEGRDPPDPEVGFVTLEGGRLVLAAGQGMAPGAERVAGLLGLEPDGDGAWSRDLAADPLTLATLDEGGGWHVSLAYSAADAWRRERGAELPDTRLRPDAVGRATPTEVVESLMWAWARGDERQAAELVLPVDGRALHDFWSLAVGPDQAAELLAEAGEPPGPSAGQVRVLDLREEGEGLQRRVVVDSAEVVLDRPGGEEVVALDGEGAPACAPAPDDPGPVSGHLVSLGADPFGAGSWCVPMSFSVVEREGRWFLSPPRTVLEAATASLGSDPSPTDLDPADTARVLVVVLERAADALTWG